MLDDDTNNIQSYSLAMEAMEAVYNVRLAISSPH